MSLENAKEFFAKAKEGDKAVVDLVKSVPVDVAKESAPGLIVEAAKAAGWDFTADELEEARVLGQEISDEELHAVAGGSIFDCCTLNHYKEECRYDVDGESICWYDDRCYLIEETYTVVSPKIS